MSKQLKVKDDSLHLNQNYRNFLAGIKQRLKDAQIRAALAANKGLVHFYWELGQKVIDQQQKYEWGENFLDQFSQDLRNEFPETKGFQSQISRE